jgi:hypothetical protein
MFPLQLSASDLGAMAEVEMRETLRLLRMPVVGYDLVSSLIFQGVPVGSSTGFVWAKRRLSPQHCVEL